MSIGVGNILAGKYQELRKRGGAQFVKGEKRYWMDHEKSWKILKDNGFGVSELGRAYGRTHGSVGKGIKRITGLIEVHRKIESMYKGALEKLCC